MKKKTCSRKSSFSLIFFLNLVRNTEVTKKRVNLHETKAGVDKRQLGAYFEWTERTGDLDWGKVRQGRDGADRREGDLREEEAGWRERQGLGRRGGEEGGRDQGGEIDLYNKEKNQESKKAEETKLGNLLELG